MYSASHIYINLKGIPCAPIKEVPLAWQSLMDNLDWNTVVKEVKQSAIPIREMDRLITFQISGGKIEIKPDIFYPVEPYEFEVVEKTDMEYPGFMGKYSTKTDSPYRPGYGPHAHIIHSEKQLFIKLVWTPDSDYGMKAETPFGWYTITALPNNGFFVYSIRGNRVDGRDTMKEAQNVAQEHFNSQVKLCLNKEL